MSEQSENVFFRKPTFLINNTYKRIKESFFMGKSKEEKVIIVGVGDHLAGNLIGALNQLHSRKVADLAFTVDVNERAFFEGQDYLNGKPHKIRDGLQTLDEIFADERAKEFAVLLAHSNHLHVRDNVSLILDQYKKVLMEKPWAISSEGLGVLETVLKKYPSNIALLEYGLHMKSAGLLLLAGLLKESSFYFTEEGLMIPKNGLSLKGLSGILPDLVGEPRNVQVSYLEGEGKTGTFQHRGPSLYLRSMGGGVIQDLFAHSMTPILALQDWIGEVDPNFEEGDVRIAVANELEKMVYERHDVGELEIAESYAEINLITSEKIPIRVRLGKYTPKDSNDRKIIIQGTKGELIYDLSNPGACFRQGITRQEIVDVPKPSDTKYYSVIRAGLEIVRGNSPFKFDSNKVCLSAQELIFNILKKAYYSRERFVRYRAGTAPDNILK